MKLETINRYATAAVMLVLGSLAVGAFILSFDVLRQEAIKYGVKPALAFIVPLIFDTSIIGGSAFVIWASINQRPKLVWLGYAVIIAVTALSVTLNSQHAQEGRALSIVYMVAPPLLLATMTFLVERMLEVLFHGVQHENKLLGMLQAAQATIAALTNTVTELRSTLQVEQATRNQLQADYNRVADVIPLLSLINPDVFLAAKVKAGLLTVDEAMTQQTTYERRNQAELFFGRVTVSAD